jgi:molybdenum cofactor biosynthesis enzyme MoaA
MGDILEEIDRNIAAGKKLEQIALGVGEPLTRDEASRLLRRIKYLEGERDALLSSLPDDD